VYDLYKIKNYKDYELLSFIFKNDTLIFLPIEEVSVLTFYDYLKNVDNHKIKFSLPNLNTFRLVRSKKLLSKFCFENNILAPKVFEKGEIIKYPVIVKPIHGSGSRGIKIYHNHADFLKDSQLFCSSVVQEYLSFSKNIIGAFAYVLNGKIISFYFHERIRTYPFEGGVTVYSKTIYNKNLYDNYFSKLIKSLNWNGLIMVEYLYDSKNETFYLIEINPRVWGSILLSSFSNANLINNYIESCSGLQFSKSKFYINYFIRWSFPYDYLYLLTNKISIRELFHREKNTCEVNFTYSKKISSLIFVLITYLKISRLFKFITK
jgi:predicted ATP-grasp superfamily ATP-dependent carboligase